MSQTIRMPRYILYTRPVCHFCDEALALINGMPGLGKVETRDISGDLELISRYGYRIPVLVRDNRAELGWPFSRGDIEALVRLNAGGENPGSEEPA
jgi:hypothetical protein